MLCTPSYALHLAEVAAENQIDVGELEVRALDSGRRARRVGAGHSRRASKKPGRPGCSTTAAPPRSGPGAMAIRTAEGLYVNENDFIAEFLSVETGTAAAEGELAELVLTNLGRVGSPVIRYRTGDLVRPSWQHAGAESLRVSRRRRARPRRRHDGHSRRECFSQLDRADPAQLSGGGRISHDGPQTAARWTSWSSRSKTV